MKKILGLILTGMVITGCSTYSGVQPSSVQSPDVSIPSAVLPMRTIGIVSDESQENVPYSAVEEGISSALSERFPTVTFKRVTLRQNDKPLYESASAWVELMNKFKLDGILRLKNQDYSMPSIGQRGYAGSALAVNPKNPYSVWRVSLFQAGTGDLVWNRCFYAGSQGMGMMAGAMTSNEQSFPRLAKEIANNWPVTPEEWAA